MVSLFLYCYFVLWSENNHRYASRFKFVNTDAITIFGPYFIRFTKIIMEICCVLCVSIEISFSSCILKSIIIYYLLGYIELIHWNYSHEIKVILIHQPNPFCSRVFLISVAEGYVYVYYAIDIKEFILYIDFIKEKLSI